LRSPKVIVYIVICSCVCQYYIFQPVAYAEDSLGESIDCTDVSVDYSDDSTLTREERLRLMDKAFLESLNKFELCQSAKKMVKAAGAGRGSGYGAEGGSGDSGVETGGMSAGQSVASSTMSGTEVFKEMPPAEGIEAVESNALQGSQDMDEAGSKTGGNVTIANGKLPEDIPSAKNDDALAAQIRYAAENETDPVKSEQLWNEYRKYRGLASKK
jgi:hypothetical protein